MRASSNTPPPADAAQRRAAHPVIVYSVDELPPYDRGFYDNSANYEASWMMCRMIAKTYGEDKLFALYEHFRNADGNGRTAWDRATQSVLGASLSRLESQYRAFSQNPS